MGKSSVDTSLSPASLGGATRGDALDFVALMKPRVMSLVVFTAFVGLVLAPGPLHPVLAVAALVTIAAGAGASGALNMWYDADIDALMTRTARRPIPAGRIARGDALGFGATVAAGSVVALGILVDWLAAGLLAFTIGFYLFVYTMWLKRRTPQNIVIGGAAGALPPVVGWAAASGTLGVEPLILFLIVFLWTPSHFWALALYRAGDYMRAGVPMLPVVAGKDETRRQILIYSLALVAVSLAPQWAGLAGIVYSVFAGLLGAGYLFAAGRVFARREGEAADQAARALFRYSIVYLFGIFLALLADQGLGLSSLVPRGGMWGA